MNKHETKDKKHQSEAIKKHFQEHPEHRAAISLAQKNKWVKYKLALKYCKEANIDLGVIYD